MLNPKWAAVVMTIVAIGCAREGGEARPDVARSLIHLSDAVGLAEVRSSPAPDLARDDKRWIPSSDWQTLSSPVRPNLATVELESLDDLDGGVQITLGAPAAPRFPLWIGGFATAVGDLSFDDWDQVLIRARTSDRFAGMTVVYNVDEPDAMPNGMVFYNSPDRAPPLFNDGSTQTYAIPLLPREGSERPRALTSLGVLFAAPTDASVDVLEIALVPRGSTFLDPFGERSVSRGGTTRHTLFAHAPAHLRYPLESWTGGRLDFGLAVIPGETVSYRVSIETEGESRLVQSATVDDGEDWQQVTVAVPAASEALVFEAESDLDGAVALWGAPILSAGDHTKVGDSGRPNIIFYVIDGGDANLMSLYEHDRATTPFLEELAAEGVLFGRAYSNSSWTQPSTVSFMTSLQHSVLGGLRRGVHSTAVPDKAVTMAEHFRRAGYQTASFSANPNAGRLIGLDRGVDILRDVETEHHSTSSFELQERFWDLREQYPGGPFWVHFQTTDVHEPNKPEVPYAGLFVSEEERARLAAWEGQIWSKMLTKFGTTSVAGFWDLAIEKTGIDRQGFFGARKGLYEETMVHQDAALREFVERLKAEGEWEKTILLIGADHGHPAGTFARFGRGLFDPQPEPWQGALFDAYATRVPLLVVAPGRIEGGRRIDRPVSMLDVMPTLLELAGLDQPEVLQGRSLAPLLRGEEIEHRPVIFDEFRVDEETGAMIGNLEIVDGRWGASLEIAPTAAGGDPSLGRHSVPAGGRWGAVHPFFDEVPRLLLYDLENDPFARTAVNDDHPELVQKYKRVLVEQWRAHRALASQFTEASAESLSPDQLNQLRALGYIQ